MSCSPKLLALGLATLALLAAPVADAAWYSGNPTLSMQVVWPGADLTDGSAVLEKVRLYHCAGGTSTWFPNVAIDPTVGWQMTLPEGNHCAIMFFWDGPVEIDGDGDNGAFSIEYDEASTTVTLVGATQDEDFTPFITTSGVVHGGNPGIVVTVQ